MEIHLESDWLLNAIRFSISAPAWATSSDDEMDDWEPQFGEIEKAILYSRKLILTYQLVLLVVLAIFTTRNWLEHVHGWKRRRRVKKQLLGNGVVISEDEIVRDIQIVINSTDDAGGASSSGSSTLEGTDSPPLKLKAVSEDTPLLYGEHSPQLTRRQRSLATSIKAFLLYQPRPVPIINKALPSNGCTILITAFLAVNVFYTVCYIKLEYISVFILADRCGLVFVANLPLLYLLVAKTQPIKFLTGYSYEALNIIHRRLGELLCFEALVHLIGMTITWYIILRPSGFGFWKFLTTKLIVLGLGAFIAYELLYFSSLGSFRARWYEIFLALHIFFQVAALILVFFHHKSSRIYVGMALTIFLIDRLVYRFSLKSFTTPANVQVMDDGETVLASAPIPLQQQTLIRRILGRSILYGWKASDHIFVSVPSLGQTYILQAHPFTIISPAPASLRPNAHSRNPTIPPAPVAADLSLLIRSQTGFSSSLLQHALEHSTLTVRIDGPYGSHHARSLLLDSDLAILIAGGSGIAVCWPLFHFLFDEQHPKRRNITLIWIIHSELHQSWLPDSAIQELRKRPGVKIVIPPATAQAGRPDLEGMIRDVVTRSGYEGIRGEGKGRNASNRIGIVASGPNGMARGVRNSCSRLVGEGWDVGVEIEKFGW